MADVMQVLLFHQPPSMYLDLSGADTSPYTTAELAPGVLIHIDDTGVVVGLEVVDAGPTELVMLPERDALYVDVSGGVILPATMAELVSDLWVHYTPNDDVIGVEVRGVARRGPLSIVEPGTRRLSSDPDW
jgi:uncharacterized protein YuzE